MSNALVGMVRLPNDVAFSFFPCYMRDQNNYQWHLSIQDAERPGTARHIGFHYSIEQSPTMTRVPPVSGWSGRDLGSGRDPSPTLELVYERGLDWEKWWSLAMELGMSAGSTLSCQ